MLAGTLSWLSGCALWFTSLEYVRRNYFEVSYSPCIVNRSSKKMITSCDLSQLLVISYLCYHYMAGLSDYHSCRSEVWGSNTKDETC